MSEGYQQEIGGSTNIPQAYAEAIGHPCENCGAEIGQLCINPINRRARKMPCKARIVA